MNCNASAMLWTRSARLMVVKVFSSLGIWNRIRERNSTLVYRRLYTPLNWCLYWAFNRRKHGVRHRKRLAGKARISPVRGDREAGEHSRHGGLPQDGRRGRARFRRVLGPSRARDARMVEAFHQG